MAALSNELFFIFNLTTDSRALTFYPSFASIGLTCVRHTRIMTAARPALERRIIAAVESTPSRIPVVLGDFRTGRTQFLSRLRERFGRTQCQQIDVERAATTPERFFGAITSYSPFRVPPRPEP